MRFGWGGWIARDKSLVLTLFGPPLASAYFIRDRTLVLIAHPQAIKKAPINGTFLLAGVAGFEPTNDGIKNRCLTAWRHPNRLELYQTFF